MLIDDYRAGLQAMGTLHRGEVMESAARSVLSRLPRGPLSLVTTSVEGAALAAVCCVLAPESGLRWEYVCLDRPARFDGHGIIVAVEPVDPGPWWRQALAQRLPSATVVIATTGRTDDHGMDGAAAYPR